MTEEELSMELAIRVAKWKSQLGELHVKEQALIYELDPKLRELEIVRINIKQHEGSLSEAFAIQIFIEDSLRKQGRLGGTKAKHTGSVLDQAEKLRDKLEVQTPDGNSDNPRPWAKSGSVSL